MNIKPNVRQNIFRKKLTANIATFMVVIMIVLYGISAVVVSNFARNALAEMKANNFRLLANNAATQITDYIDKFETASGVISQNPMLINAVSNATKEAPISQNEDFSALIQMLKTFVAENDEVLNIGFGVMQEDTSYTQEGKSLGSVYSLKESKVYEAIEKNQGIVTKPYQDAFTGKLCVSIVEPIRSRNTPVGLLFIDLNLDYFSELMETIPIGETGKAALFTADGTIIAFADKAMLGQKASEEIGFAGEAFYAELEKPSGQVIDFSYYDANQKAIIVEVPECEWRFISGISKAEYLKEITVIVIFLIVSILLATILIDILAIWYIKKKLAPIHQINSYILRLADGYIDFDVVQTQENELGEIESSLKRCTENIATYIREIDHIMSDLSQGDFTSEISCEFQGDFQSIQNSINKFKELFSQTISNVVIAVDQISAGSNQVSDGAQSLAQGATEQASSIQELSATIGEISDQVTENANHSKKASELATVSGTVAEATLHDMEEMLGAMSQISASAENIGKVIKVIGDITFQTNILSLNAAVEAARAGTVGKGFSVVADEVRNLAQKSSDSAQEITTLIEDAVSAAHHGEAIAQKTSMAFGDLTVKIREGIEIINQITTASEIQANSIQQITGGMDQISAVVQTNSATSEEGAAASEELSSQVEMLTSLVNQFKIKAVDSESNV